MINLSVALAASGCVAAAANLAADPGPFPLSGPGVHLGPQLGHVGHERARVWARAAEPGVIRLWVIEHGASAPRSVEAAATADDDLCVVFDVAGLRPATEYRLAFSEAAPDPSEPGAWPGTFRTAPDPAQPARVSLAFGSCCKDRPGEPLPVFATIASYRPDALVLIGDTPYIDSTDLGVQRRRYREFFANPQLAALRASTATYATWDDHDFGRNDTDGRMKGRDNARRAFVEYHANAGPDGRGDRRDDGENGEGIYSKFRTGPVEVFLIDARWFSRTGPSPVDPEQPTLLGARQWEWLKRELRASTATFKVLATGMIWNESVRPLKTDYWGAYPHERAAVWKFVSDERIDGVVLMGGDIHRSRLLRHAPEFAGTPYPLYEFVSSPLSQSVHANANVPHPSLLWDSGDPSVFLLMEADSTASPPALTGRWINAAGEELRRVTVRADEIACPRR